MKKLITTVCLVLAIISNAIAQTKIKFKEKEITLPGKISCTVAGIDHNPTTFENYYSLDAQRDVLISTTVQTFKGDPANNKDIEQFSIKLSEIELETLPEIAIYDDGSFAEPVYKVTFNGKGIDVKYAYCFKENKTLDFVPSDNKIDIKVYFKTQEAADLFIAEITKLLKK
jgi:hypothetical protein